MALSVLTVLLLTVLMISAVVSVAGVLLARDAFDRIHYLGPASLVGGPALLLAVVADRGFDIGAARTAVVVVVLIVLLPIGNHAIARAGLARGDVARRRDGSYEVRQP